MDVSREFGENFKNIYFIEHLRRPTETASVWPTGHNLTIERILLLLFFQKFSELFHTNLSGAYLEIITSILDQTGRLFKQYLTSKQTKEVHLIPCQLSMMEFFENS